MAFHDYDEQHDGELHSDLEDPFCISERCGICYFKLHPGEDIILGHDRVAQIPLMSGTFKDTHGAMYQTCTAFCDHDLQVTSSHLSCVKLVQLKSYGRLLDIAKPAFEPVARESSLWYDLTHNLKLNLPAELRWEIARYLLQDYAAALIGALEISQPASTTLNLSLPITFCYSTYESHHYICRAENISCNKPVTPAAIYISESPFGITKIFLSQTGAPPKASYQPDIWWKTLPISRETKNLTLRSDGYKLRELFHNNQSTISLTSWSIPQTAGEFRSETGVLVPGSQPLQMKLLDYGHKNITGVSVCCNPAPRAFHIHTDGDDDLGIYKSTGPFTVWVHIPLVLGEYISSLWIRPRSKLNKELALAFVTTKNRVVVAGAEGTRYLSGLKWKLLDTPNRHSSFFFFDCHSRGIRKFMFSSPTPVVTQCPLPIRPMLPSYLRNASDFFYSSASLRGAITLRKCCRYIQERWETIGLLLSYKSGEVSSIGQVRWDCLGETTDILPRDRLWLAFKRMPRGYPYMTDARLSDAPVAGTGWAGISCDGTLEWWYSYRQCHIIHNGQAVIDNLVLDA